MIKAKGKPTLFQALIPVIFLIILLSVNVYVFGDEALSGSNQIVLALSAAVAALLALRIGISWARMQKVILRSISSAMSALMILLLIGALAGTWLISGIVPAMIYYGLKILNPTIFLFAACLVSAIVSLATGSSWSTIATIGVALLGIGTALGLHEGLIAGAIISGAYFGDKMSPLSDTTNMAPAMAGTDLFTHIRYMMYTTVPSIVLTLLIFLVIGFSAKNEVSLDDVNIILETIDSTFTINIWLFIVPAVVITMIVRRVPAIPALLVGTLLGVLFAIIFQPNILRDVGESYMVTSNTIEALESSSADAGAIYHITSLKNKIYVGKDAFINVINGTDGKFYERFNDEQQAFLLEKSTAPFSIQAFVGSMKAMYTNTQVTTDYAIVNDLLSSGGMSGMLNTVWLVLCAMTFGGVMEAAGFLKRIAESVIQWAQSTGSLIASTAATCIFFNITASEQYLAIMIPGRMFANSYRQRGLAPENLSRTLEDSGTVTSVLVPWNTCGATQSTVLGVATLTYLPYCFFNIVSPIMTILFGYLGIKIRKIAEKKNVK